MIRAWKPERALPYSLCGCFVLTAALGMVSAGVYQDDDLTHFLFARWARWFPEYLLHVWGRPGLTIPLASVSWVSDVQSAWHSARLLSAAVTALSALIAARLAAPLGVKRQWVVVLLCYAQPLVGVVAATTLTENFAGLYLVAAVALLRSKRVIIGSMVFSLLLVTRHEAAILWPVWIFAVLMTRSGRLKCIAAAIGSLLAPILHNVLFYFTFGAWPFSIFGQATGSTEYPAAGALAYVPDALYAISPLIVGLAIVGGITLWRRGERVIPAMTGMFLGTHILIRWFGLFASGGYGRFMVTVAPFVAILAALALESLVENTDSRRSSRLPWIVMACVWVIGLVAIEQQRTAGRFAMDERMVWSMRVSVSAIVILLVWLALAGRSLWAQRAGLGVLGLTVLAQWIVMVTPLPERGEQRLAKQITGWIAQRGLSAGPFFATNPWFSLYLDLIENPRAHKGPTLLASMPVGTIVLWDSKYSDSDFHRISLDALRNDSHYESLSVFRSVSRTPIEVQVFRKIAQTALPDEPDTYFPADPSAAVNQALGSYYIRP